MELEKGQIFRRIQVSNPASARRPKMPYSNPPLLSCALFFNYPHNSKLYKYLHIGSKIISELFVPATILVPTSGLETHLQSISPIPEKMQIQRIVPSLHNLLLNFYISYKRFPV